jgi:hypothetical protein
MSGGPTDPQVPRDEAHGVVFSPLPPPRMPPKEAP